MALSHYARRHVYNESITVTYLAYLPTDASYGAFCINGDDWDGLNDICFEAYISGVGAGNCSPNGDPTPYLGAQLYDLTAAANVGNLVTLSPYAVGIARSGPIGVTSFASGNHWYIVKLISLCSTTTSVRSLDIMFGVSTTATKWCKYIELGTNFTATGTTYLEGTVYGPKRCTWGGDTAYGAVARSLSFEATIKATATRTTSIELYDQTDFSALSTLTSTNTSYEGVVEDGIGEPSGEGDELRVLIKSSNTLGIAYEKMATLVVKQSGSPTTSMEHITLTSAAQNADTSTSYATILHYDKLPSNADYPYASIDYCYFGGVGIINKAGAGKTHYARLSDGATTIAASEINTTSTAYTHMKSGAFASPLNLTDYLTTQYKYAVGTGTQVHDYVEMMQTISYPAASTKHFLTILGCGT